MTQEKVWDVHAVQSWLAEMLDIPVGQASHIYKVIRSKPEAIACAVLNPVDPSEVEMDLIDPVGGDDEDR